MKLSLWLGAKTIAAILRIICIAANVEGIYITSSQEITSSGLAPLAATDFKSNYGETSALKGLTARAAVAAARGSSSNYYSQKPQQKQQQELNNYYTDSGELKANIVNEAPLTREEQTGFVATANGFVPTAIIAAGHQTIKGYNSNNGNLQNMYDNNYLNNNNNNKNNNQHEIDVDASGDIDVFNDVVAIDKWKMNMKKYMKIPKDKTVYTINNRNYVPTTSTRELQYGQAASLYADGHDDVNDSLQDNIYLANGNNNYNNEENYYLKVQQQPQQQTETPISYLHDYQNMQFDDYDSQQQHLNNDAELRANFFGTQIPTAAHSVDPSEHLQKGIYNTQTTNYVTLNQQQQQTFGGLRQLQKLALTNNDKLESNNNRPKYYEQHHPLRPQWPTARTIVRHNPQSEAALVGIPLARHVAVTKQVPVVVQHQRILQPYNQSVTIEVPQTVINTQSRPIPIQVPVPQTIAVPEMRDLHIPIEKLHPYPVERPTPYLVERHIPYSVERQVAIPYYYPYPIRVPIVKTVVHKSPAHKHTKTPAHGGGFVIKRVQRQPASLFH